MPCTRAHSIGYLAPDLIHTETGMSLLDKTIHITRPYEPGDQAAVVDVWRRSGDAAYQFLPTWQAYTLEDHTRFFRNRIVKSCDIWVGIDEGEVTGYLALNGSYIDRLYISPDCQRAGLGSHFIAMAKDLHPNGLELHTHQENLPACAFYEKHGFTVFKLGISPPPESVPDVEYHWRPSTISTT